MISRRQASWLITTGALMGAYPDSLLAADFWDKKDPSDWTAEEIEKMLTKSPWAKQVALNADRNGGAPGGMGGGMPGGGGGMPGGGGGGMPGGGGGGMPGGGGGGMPGGGGGGMPGGAPGGGPGATPKSTVRWESALPILLASKKQVSAAESEFYIVSVADLPLGGGGGGRGPGRPGGPGAEKGKAQPLELLTAYLRSKDKQSFRADNSETVAGVIRFYFRRTNHLFIQEEKEITFEAQLGPTALKAKFSLKEMTYRGKLEL